MQTHGDRHSGENDPFEREAFAAWLGGRSAATRRAYCADINDLAEWLFAQGVDSPSEVSRLTLRRWLGSLAARELAKSTIARKAAAVRSYFAWLASRDAIAADPAAVMELRRWLTARFNWTPS